MALVRWAGVFLLCFSLCAASHRKVTFNKQIAPIIYGNCSACHRLNEAAPFSLLSYDDGKRHAKQIAEALAFLPNDLELHTSLGEAFLRLGRISDARLQFEAALHINPGFKPAADALATMRTGN